MRIDRCDGRQPATVGNAQDPDAAVVRWDVLDEPINAVVGVRAFIDCFIVFVIPRRTIHDESSL